MITLTELTDDQLNIVIQDRRDNAIAANPHVADVDLRSCPRRNRLAIR